MKRTVLLPLLYGLTLRNFLRTGFLDALLEKDVRLVCLIPSVDIDDLKDEFGPRGVEFREYTPYDPGELEKRIRDLREVQFYKTHPMFVARYKAQDIKNLNPLRWFVNFKLFSHLLPKAHWCYLDNWYQSLHRTESVDALWHEVKPDLLLSTNSFFWEEIPHLAKAQRTGIPTYGMIHSWDNLTTKNKLPYPFTRTGVWNQLMLDEMKRFYPDCVSSTDIIGVPQFDLYETIEKEGKSKEQFLKDLNLDPTLPLISYTTVPDKISSSCFHDVKILCEAVKAGRFGGDVNVLVRFHQTGNMKPFEALEDFPRLHVEKPGRMNPMMKDLYNPTREDTLHFADTLRHSDCTINVRSTVSIDASFFDTPIINPGADFAPGGQRSSYMKDLYLWEHYLPITASGAVEVVETPEQYVDAIACSLKEPEYRREGRKRLRDMYTGPEPGQAGARLAHCVFSLLNCD